MRPLLTALLALSLALLLAGAAPARDQRVWTHTRPPINATHIFHGEINRRGKPTGFHAKTNGKVPRGVRIVRVQAGPNRAGVYTARVAIRDPRSGQWKEKFSTLFPDRLTPREVVQAILHAYRHRERGKSRPWRGPSGLGFPIEGYLRRDGRINTAYPIYIRDRRK